MLAEQSQRLYCPVLCTGVKENVSSLTVRSDHIHQTSGREHKAAVKTMLGMCQCVLSHNSTQIFGLLHRSRSAEKVGMENTSIPTRPPALQTVFTKPQILLAKEMGGWTLLVFPRCESSYSTRLSIMQASRGCYSCTLCSVQPGRLHPVFLSLKAG